MEPTTGASPYRQMSEQHIRLRQQYNSQPYPPRLEHQPQTPGAHNPWAAEANLEAYLQDTEQSRQYQTALVAVQALEHQRLQKSLQDGEENPRL